MRFSALLLATFIFSFVAEVQNSAFANEAAFLSSMNGKWRGTGTVRVNTSAPSVNVNCNFNSTARANRFNLKGNCRALLVVKKMISARLAVSNNRYRGSYVGAATGTAGLSGTRSGNRISLKVKWAGRVNGDRMARMAIRKRGANRLELTISDRNPKTGRRQITSRINLTRK